MQKNIKTVYYSFGSKAVLKTNYANTVKKAAVHAFEHLQNNDYEAWIAVITGEYEELYAILKYSTTGNITIMFQRDPRKPVVLTSN